jgi:hypothetical protein
VTGKAQTHRRATIALSVLMAAIGLGLIGEAVAGDGGVLSVRLLLGVLFVAAGIGRTYVESRRRGAS